jgi:hypothetical protein
VDFSGIDGSATEATFDKRVFSGCAIRHPAAGAMTGVVYSAYRKYAPAYCGIFQGGLAER